MRLVSSVREVGESRRAAASVEYAVLIGILVVGVVLGVAALGKSASARLDSQGGQLSSAPADGAPPGAPGGGGTTPGGAGGTPAPPKTDRVTLFADSFDRANGKDKKAWTFRGGWRHKDGRLEARKVRAGGELIALADGVRGSDYTAAVDANLIEGDGYGVFFRASGKPNKVNGYTFQYDPGADGGQFVVRKWINGVEIWPPVAAAPAPPGYRWHGTTRHVEVTTRGSDFLVLVDGELVLTGRDATHASGTAGLRFRGPGEVAFDNFSVTAEGHVP